MAQVKRQTGPRNTTNSTAGSKPVPAQPKGHVPVGGSDVGPVVKKTGRGGVSGKSGSQA